MFELKNGMILELCNGDFGVFYDRNVICQSYPKRRKTTNFSYGDIRRVRRIYVSN